MNYLEFCHMGELSLLPRLLVQSFISVSGWIHGKVIATLCCNTIQCLILLCMCWQPQLWKAGALSIASCVLLTHPYCGFFPFSFFWSSCTWVPGSLTRDKTCAPCIGSTVSTVAPPGKSLWVFLIVEHILSLYTARCSTLISCMSDPSGRTSRFSRALTP